MCGTTSLTSNMLRETIHYSDTWHPVKCWPSSSKYSPYLGWEKFSTHSHCSSKSRDRYHTWNELDEEAWRYHQYLFSYPSVQLFHVWFYGFIFPSMQFQPLSYTIWRGKF